VKEILLHLGIPKTGSTALQVFLARNYGALLSRSIDYFRMGEFDFGLMGKIAAGNGVHVACSLLPETHRRRVADGERYFNELDQMIERSPAERGVLSSELFASADRRMLAAFLSRLAAKGVSVQAIYYIRRQDQILSSSYIQQVRLHGHTEPPDAYVRDLAERNEILRYHSFYRTMTGLFGKENVKCRTYEEAAASENGVFGDFLEAAGIAGDGLSFAVPTVNASISDRQVAILLLLNRFRPGKRFVEMVIENADKDPRGAGRHSLLSRRLRVEIASMFQEENARLANEYFERPELFAPDPLDGPEDPLASSELTAEDLIIFLGGLLVRFDGRLTETGKIARAAAAQGGVELPEPGLGKRMAGEATLEAPAEL